MASSGRRGAGERVLESKHVIGLFFGVLIFSGVFFALGYKMGRDQYDGSVRASGSGGTRASEPTPAPKTEAPAKKPTATSAPKEDTDPANAKPGGWDFYTDSKSAKPQPALKPEEKTEIVASVPPPSVAPKAANTSKPVVAKPIDSRATPQPATAKTKSTPQSGASFIPSGSYLLQVAAVTRQDDALDIAGRLQKKHYPAFVQTPQKDKFYRVQVGPLKDQKSAETIKKGLEGEGFKAFYVKH